MLAHASQNWLEKKRFRNGTGSANGPGMDMHKAKLIAKVLVLASGTLLGFGCVADVEDGGGDSAKQEQNQADACWDFGPDAPGECTIGDERVCPDTDPNNPSDFCREKCVNINGAAVWGLQTTDMMCPFYESTYFVGTSDQCQCNTPLVLSFENAPVTFTAEAGAAFDLTRAGMCHTGDWPTAATPWLAMDRDGNGSIEDGGELFGSATRLGNGAFAKNGFEALRDLDADHNGVFDARDPAFASVVVWADANLDRQSEPEELRSLASTGVTSIDLHDARDIRCDARGNCEGEKSAFAFVDATGNARRGTVIDVYLPMK